ncbi:MAG: hypothetical protein E6J73_22115 [Deltaproteobacteria bacterium]|nr:MAG: hypothetical protein E6J73_22115 [Deltaproteobacteria bacterium]
MGRHAAGAAALASERPQHRRGDNERRGALGQPGNTYWRKYNIAELKELEPGKWEAVHGGYNVAYMNQNPHYGVPLDALRTLEAEGAIGPGKLYPAYYVIPGNQGSPTVMRRIGQEIAADLKKDNVEGVLFVAT